MATHEVTASEERRAIEVKRTKRQLSRASREAEERGRLEEELREEEKHGQVRGALSIWT